MRSHHVRNRTVHTLDTKKIVHIKVIELLLTISDSYFQIHKCIVCVCATRNLPLKHLIRTLG